MQATGPRFRQDHLLAEPIEESGARFVDVMDPDSGSLFRFHEIEFSLACAMDGNRDIAGIVKWAQDELGVTPSPSEVRHVVATLSDLGYLDRAGDARAAAAATPTRPSIEEARPAQSAEPSLPTATPGRSSTPRPTPSIEEAGWPMPAPRVHDDELAPGIVVGAQAKLPPMPSGGDVELGNAGTSPLSPVRDQELPKAENIDLGVSGASASKLPVPTAPEDVALGLPGRGVEAARPQVSEVSLDLSKHIEVGTDDVKQAVLASRVMPAVEPPKDVAAAKPADKAIDKAIENAAATLETKPAEKAKPVEKAKPADKSKPAEKAKPVEGPAMGAKTAQKSKDKSAVQPTQKVAEKTPVAPPAPASGVSPLLIVFLLLALGGAAAYFVWKYMLKTSNTDSAASSSVKPTPTPPAKRPDPAPPAPPAIKLAIDTPAPLQVKAAAAGQLETEAVTTVKKDAVVVKIAGYRPIAAEVDALTRTIEKQLAPAVVLAEKDLVAAKATNNAASITRNEARVDAKKKALAEKQAALEAKQADLAKYMVKAPADGEVTLVAKPGKVAVDDVLFSLAPAPVLVATFKSDGAPAAGSRVYVSVTGKDKKLVCQVTQVDADGTKVVCPLESTLAGAEVTLAGPVPEALATPEVTPAPTATPPAPAPPTATPPTPTPAPAQPKRIAPKPAPKATPKPVPTPTPTEPKPAAETPPTPPPAEPAPAGSGATP